MLCKNKITPVELKERIKSFGKLNMQKSKLSEKDKKDWRVRIK